MIDNYPEKEKEILKKFNELQKELRPLKKRKDAIDKKIGDKEKKFMGSFINKWQIYLLPGANTGLTLINTLTMGRVRVHWVIK